MITLRGKYNTANVYTDNVEQKAVAQIIELCNQEFAKHSKIAIMPDTHAGAGCTIGTTMTLEDKVVPNLVGYDIGCGMLTVLLKEKDVDLEKLDKIVREFIPSGPSIRKVDHKYNKLVPLNDLKCKNDVDIDRARKSIGTMGSGNHFLELAKDSNGNIYIIVHSGSRHLGKQIAVYYQDKAIKNLSKNIKRKELIEQLKKDGRQLEIEKSLIDFSRDNKIPKEFAYLEGDDYQDYLHDMCIAQFYAQTNRKAIADTILEKMGLHEEYSFNTVHNYIDIQNKILRKGAIAAHTGEKVLIPINMCDGSILAIGKGNPEWNYSAPHGAGRLMSRSKAKELISMDEFRESMKDVFTTSVSEATMDEAPMAYKPIDEILSNIGDTVEVIGILKPIYNFKAS